VASNPTQSFVCGKYADYEGVKQGYLPTAIAILNLKGKMIEKLEGIDKRTNQYDNDELFDLLIEGFMKINEIIDHLNIPICQCDYSHSAGITLSKDKKCPKCGLEYRPKEKPINCPTCGQEVRDV